MRWDEMMGLGMEMGMGMGCGGSGWLLLVEGRRIWGVGCDG